jgi:hypothetical protein
MAVMKEKFLGPIWMVITAAVFLASGSLNAQPSFTGEVVQMPAQVIAPGEAELVISLDIPPGYELLRDLPLLAKVTSSKREVVFLAEGASATCRQPTFPLRLPLKANPGVTQLRVDLVLYYCTTKGGGLCITKEARLNLPVTVDQAASTKELQASYRLPAI